MIVGRSPGIFVSVLVGANATTIQPLWWAILLVAIALAAVAFWRWGEQLQDRILALIEHLVDHSTR
jgi:hypothetical protein